MSKHIIEMPKKEAVRPAFVGFTCTCGMHIAVSLAIDNATLFQCANCNRQFTVSVMLHSIQLLKPVDGIPKDNPGGPNG